MQSKICMVTGATSGIGLVTARELARMGAHVILHGRSEQRLAQTVQAIRTAVPGASLDTAIADLVSYQAIRDLVTRFKASYDHLDVLVNNAGLFSMTRKETADGFEMTFAANHLGPFLLTNLLLETLIASAPSRIVNVASEAHVYGTMDFDDLHLKRGYGSGGMNAYGRSKLANVLFTYELARRLQGTGVTANVLHPGFVSTNIWSTTPIIGRFLKPLFSRAALTPEEGARTTIYLASSPEVEGVTGKYFDKQVPVESSELSLDEQVAEHLWEVSEQMVNLNQQ